MVTAAASTARPMIWPPTRRVSRGKDVDTSATRMGTCAGDGDGVGEGVTCGKARLGSSTGLGRAGSPAAENSPGGRFEGGSNAPVPTELLPLEVAEGVGSALTRTLADPDAEAFACGEVPVAVRVTRVPAAFVGTATAARSWTGWEVRPTEHTFPPDGVQTVKLGAGVAGFAAMVTFAVPFPWPASQTQIA
jgi:hypothetical protein